MPTDQPPKQQIVERIKNASNILVTVSKDPSVDELSAALAFTLFLDKMEKSPTAVFSGTIPPAIEFLEPGKTFDENVDSLRDFIIALDKEKADRLRYKVEGDVVRVFITPYKTTITEADLSFSQGDFNVDLIVAFGVDKREDLDTAITAHGRILHDAAIVTINQDAGERSLGEVDWTDADASCLCEMLMSLTEALQSGLLDQQIATALLTGLVSSTDRFRNNNTSPKVMTMAAQLMAAGANQQLIAEKLEEATTVSTGKLSQQSAAADDEIPAQKRVDGEMRVDHEAEAAAQAAAVQASAQTFAEKASTDAVHEAQQELAEVAQSELPPVAPPPVVTPPPVASSPVASPTSPQISHPKSSWRDSATPSLGGTLNATTDEAAEEKRRIEEDDQNRVILSHDVPEADMTVSLPTPPVLNAIAVPDKEPNVQDIFAAPPQAAPVLPPAPTILPSINDSMTATGIGFEATPVPAPLPTFPAPAQEPISTPAPSTAPAPAAPVFNQTLADLEAEMHRNAEALGGASSLDSARAAVDAALGAQPFDPSGNPLQSVGAQPLGEIAHNVPPPPPVPVQASPALPPLPDFSTLPPLPGEGSIAQPATTVATPNFGLPEQPASQPASTPITGGDPAQFKLPGQ